MPYQYKLHPVAQKEYESSLSWYLERSLDAAENFVKEVDAALVEICRDPNRYRNKYKNYREYGLRKYPFDIVYVVEQQSQLVVIVAIFHEKRHPRGKYRKP